MWNSIIVSLVLSVSRHGKVVVSPSWVDVYRNTFWLSGTRYTVM